MLVYEYKLSGSKKQYAAIDEAIRIVQFSCNESLQLWMDKLNDKGHWLGQAWHLQMRAVIV